MIVAGIDEAGYGPLLGPLVVTGVAFSVPDTLGDADIWDVLGASICRLPSPGDFRLPIGDSKKLYNRKVGLSTLERTALAMLQTAGGKPTSLRRLLDAIAPAANNDLTEYPWYRGYDTTLPFTTTASDIATRANAVHRDLAAHDVALLGVFTELLPEGHFNRMVDQTRNKANVLMRLALRIVQRMLPRSDGQMHIHIDRHGGRAHYVDKLLTYFQGANLRIVEESSQCSAYALTSGPHTWTMSFITKGEDHHLPIALASVFSKYVRELLMGGVNAYFAERIQGLRPTAGYYNDGQRYVDDIADVIRSECIDRLMLIRAR